MAERIETKLRDSLAPAHLEVHDDSHKHEGHSGARPGGETHFRVVAVADAFEGKSRVARQRLVYAALAEEMQERVHALQLTTLTPQEAEARQRDSAKS
jgi:BolA protein